MKPTILLIMAAGIGSRFGAGIKQLEPVGLNDEISMDYSIHDAIAAGFNRIVFVMRLDIEEDFKERIGNRIEAIVEDSDQRFYTHSKTFTVCQESFQREEPSPGAPGKLSSLQNL